jgi:D-glycero-beta-D-manno-heptose-7-phosphate kinase
MASISDTIRTGFAGRKVAIIGDMVADQFLSGTIDRVSREAPVFIMRHDETVTLPGAAANAAANVAALGGTPIPVGIIGADHNGGLLIESLEANRVDIKSIAVDSDIATTTKVRVLGGQPHAQRQQVIRIDYENRQPLSRELTSRLLENIARACSQADAVVVSDYNYGVATSEIFAETKRLARERGLPILVDSRFRLADFAGATAATPNQDEVEQILGKGFQNADCEALRKKLELEALLVTNGNKGMQLFENARQLQIDAVGSLNPVDVTGAGDTVIAAFSLGLAAGLDFAAAARIANHAGGLVVMKKRTATVTAAELADSVTKYSDLTSQTNA